MRQKIPDADTGAPHLVADNPGLVASNIGKAFKKRPVLRDVSLSVKRGEVVGLLGPNGAGKTTCFYIVTGLISPDYGLISLDGEDITGLPMYRRSRMGLGYLPQESSIFRGLSVENNIRAMLEVSEPLADRRESRLEDLLAEFSLTHLRRTPALALSGGERRRVEIARALAANPSFMLLDEPLAGIDPIAVNDIRNLVSHLKDRTPDYGLISLDGEDITGLPMYRRSRMGLGYLPQESSIFRGLSVENNIRAMLEVSEPLADRRESRLEDLLAEFSLTHLRRTPALALSGGERRRVEIARALAANPSFMLLDEPLAGIDPIAVNDIRNLVSHLKDRGIGVLITDHNVRETLDIVDRAYILHDGKVLMEGAPAEIVTHKDVRRVYLGERFSL